MRVVLTNCRKRTVRKTPGFTLAEVLITLGIIGIIAALTIPQLINAYQKQVTAENFKKFFSSLENALKLAEVDYGSRSSWPDYYNGNDNISASEFTDAYIAPYMTPTKQCGYNHLDLSECLFNYQYKTYTQPDGKTALPVNSVNCFSGGAGSFGGSYGCNYLQLLDGSVLAIEIRAWHAAQFAVDLNGPLKGPNSYGKDVFNWIMLNNGSGKITLDAGSVCSYSDGGRCSRKLVLDGYQIQSDYPW